MVLNFMDFPSRTTESTEIDPAVFAGGFVSIEGDRQLYVDTESHERGSAGVFYPVYTDDNCNDRYGFYCENCQTTAVNMDTMGRLACRNCENERKPTQWDAAYL